MHFVIKISIIDSGKTCHLENRVIEYNGAKNEAQKLRLPRR